MSAEPNEVSLGEPVPDFCLPDKEKNRTCLGGFTGRWVVLYFYPKDNTSGCALEALDFTAARGEFEKLGAVVLGVSPDLPESHCRFADKHGLDITLLSDHDHAVLEQYGVWQKKKLYGREFWGVVRSTFIVDPEGRLRHRWRKVKGHVHEVRAKLREPQGA
jgi:peroxiredoxin Q/BCP